MALFLALYLAAFSGRPLTVTLLYGVRTFLPLPHYTVTSDCLACIGVHCNADYVLWATQSWDGDAHVRLRF